MSALSPLLIAAIGASLATVATAQVAGTVRMVEGKALIGTFTVLEDGSVTVSNADGRTQLNIADMVSFERADAKPRKLQVENQIWLRSGAELPAKKLLGRPAVDGQPAVLIARLPSGIDLELPISSLRAIRQGGLTRPQPSLFASDLATPPANNDLIYVVRDGKTQRSAVSLTSITDKTVNFDLRGKDRVFELKGLAAVVFGANTGFAPDRQPRPRTVVVLTTGERIEGKLISVGETVRCRVDEGFVVDVPAHKLHRLEVSSDKLVWLSELSPDVVQTPAFDRVWPWYADRSIAGPGFDLAGRHYDRGLGLVPHTRLTYDLAGRFDMFEATIGIDDRGGPQAHALFRVLVDGKEVFVSPAMTRGQKPQELRLVLNKAQSLALEVNFGKNYDLGDFCAFADARVTQQ